MKAPIVIFAMAVLGASLWTPLAAAQPAAPANKPGKAGTTPTVSNAWARATVPGQPVGAAYMTMVSPDDTQLITAQADIASAVEVHDMHQHAGIMKMRRHELLALKANEPTVLKPGGMHFMLLGLKKPLIAGETVQLKLTFGQSEKAEDKRSIVVDVPVRPIGQ